MKRASFLVGVLAAVVLNACAGNEGLPPAKLQPGASDPLYRIGPGDTLTIFVWRNEELSTSVPVRPDGRISVPLLEDVEVTGKTPTELAREIEGRLAQFIQDPLVTVIVTGFVGVLTEQVRVVGEAAVPQAIPYRAKMTLLDIIIAVGGLTEFAAGNRSSLIRMVDNEQKVYRVRIDDLVKKGDIDANVEVFPGDVIIIPQSYF
jgi:polysaccharide export outer membrane protein